MSTVAPARRYHLRIPLAWILLAATVGVGALGGALQLFAPERQLTPWVLGAFAAGIAAWRLARMIADLRSGHWGIDVLAVLAIASSLVAQEFWAAWVISLMMTGGTALEDYASRRSHGEIRALLERAPRTAVRIDPVTGAQQIPVAALAVGDVVLVRPGDAVPVDGVVLDAPAELDLSSLTGESLPETVAVGARVPSGASATTVPVRLRCVAGAADSEYQRIVAAVEQAAGSRARFARLADRISVPFTVLAVALAAIAWGISGEFLRLVEVLVVATPCPLLIAAPAAFVAGMGRSARAGVVLKNAEALERLAAVRSVAFDKTGTLTGGAVAVDHVEAGAGVDPDRVLALAAAAETVSSHALAGPIVAAARERALELPALQDLEEAPGEGMTGTLGREAVRVGRGALVDDLARTPSTEAVTNVLVSLGGRPLGSIALRDPVRPDAARLIEGLRRDGVERIVMVTGDDAATAARVAQEVGIAEVQAGLRPEQKARAVAELQPRPVMMVGDGINDVLVLASADLGVAINREGLAAAAESADAVILSGRLGALLDARRIARRTHVIAQQSVWFGVIASVGLMGVAMTGVLPPILGAVAQETVDVLTILNALRATRVPIRGLDETRRSARGQDG